MDHQHCDHPAPEREPKVGVERLRPFDKEAFERAVTDLLTACGFQPQGDPHLGKTAERVSAFWRDRLLDGYAADPSEVLGCGFEDNSREMVIISNISIHSLCPHHLVPFEGIAHVAYIPGGRLHGFGRIARLIDVISHRLNYQEWICQEVADALVRHGMAKGAACVIQAKQMCLQLGENRRGAEAVITQGFAGEVSEADRARFLSECKQAPHR